MLSLSKPLRRDVMIDKKIYCKMDIRDYVRSQNVLPEGKGEGDGRRG